METSELIRRFLEETNYNNKKDVMLIIAYGSRITNTASKNSDLDILIITSKRGTYKRALFIDGIPVDLTIMSLDDAEDKITYSKVRGSAYFDAVLAQGIIVIDKMNTFDYLSDLLNYKVNKKRFIDKKILALAENHFYQFFNGDSAQSVHYFSALELMRKLYHAKFNCSNIQSSKVYDLYTDKDKATRLYKLKLPSDSFIQDYLSALQETDENEQKRWLIKFFSEFENIPLLPVEDDFISDNQKMIRLINLNSAVWKCEDLILRNSIYARPLFYIVIGEIYYLYRLINGTELQIDIDFAPQDTEQMIQTLELLFSLVDFEHKIDYNDYTIRLS